MRLRSGSRRAYLAAAALALVLTAGCQRSSPDGAAQAEVMAAVKVNGRAGSLAGISARGGIEVPRFRPAQFGADTASVGFHEFRRRCATCHDAPRPDLHDAREWRDVVTRMHGAMGAAGVLGLSEDERAAILDLLQRHARR